MNSTKEWNNNLMELFIPADILLILFLIAGITGNSLVIAVYGFKLKRIKDGQYFIPYLAVVDMLGSIVCSLFGLSITLMPRTYGSDSLCKSGWFVGSATTFMSVFMLVTIAVQRYLKVCRQYNIPLKFKRSILLTDFILSVGFACPTVVTYGSVPFEDTNKNFTGRICGKIQGTGSFIYDVIISIGVFVCCCLLIALYSLVGRKMYKYMKRSKQQQLSLKNNKYLESKSVSTLGNGSTEKHKTRLDTSVIVDKSISCLETDLNTNESAIPGIIIENVAEPSSSDQNTQEQCCWYSKSGKDDITSKVKVDKTNKRKISRITIMFMVITIIFLLCAIPKLTLVILETIITNFWTNFSDTEKAVLIFVHQGYILNNVVNPVIYTFLDETFKNEMKKMFCFK